MIESSVYKSLVSKMIVLLLFAAISMIECRKKIDVKADIVVVIQKEYPAGNEAEMDLVKAAYDKFANMFEMADDKTRVAIAQPHYVQGRDFKPILMDLTSDRQKFNDTIRNYVPMTHFIYPTGREEYVHETDGVYKEIRTKVFGTSSLRAKITVEIGMIPYFNHSEGLTVEEESKRLRHGKAFLYFIAKDGIAGLVEESKRFAGFDSRVMVVNTRPGQRYENDQLDNAMEKVKEALLRDLCWKSLCSYDDKDQTSCTPKVFEPAATSQYFDANGKTKNCVNNKPPEKTCPKDECEKDCDREWPWIDFKSCTAVCDKSMVRMGNAPEKMQHCSTKCASCITTTAIPTTTSKKKDKGAPGVTKTTPGDKKWLWGIIGGIIGGLVLLVIIGIIVAVVLTKKKSAAAAAKKAQMKKSTTKSISQKTLKMPTGKEAFVAAPMPGKSAEASVRADMSTRSVSLFQSPKSMAGKSMMKKK